MVAGLVLTAILCSAFLIPARTELKWLLHLIADSLTIALANSREGQSPLCRNRHSDVFSLVLPFTYFLKWHKLETPWGTPLFQHGGVGLLGAQPTFTPAWQLITASPCGCRSALLGSSLMNANGWNFPSERWL